LPGDGATRRKERLAEIARSVQAALFESAQVGWVSLQKVVASISISTGLVPSRILEYLQLLNEAGQFELDISDGKIKRKAPEAEQS
jgi:hypothetical protein